MKKRIFVGALIVMVMVLFFSSGSLVAQEKQKVIELSYSSFFPPTYGIAKATEAWSREIEKRTNGQVKITVYHGGTLSSAQNCYEGVTKGISDIGQSVLAYTRGRFPLMEVIDLPGYTFNGVVTSKVAMDVYEKFRPKELDDVHVLFLHAHVPGVFYTVKKPVKTLEDMKGMRIRATGLSTKIVDALGATSVAMPKGDQYDALQKGVVDGSVGSLNELKGWKVAEVAKYSTLVPQAGYVSCMFVAMNKKSWNALPKDIQNVFTEVSKEWVDYTGKVWNDIDIEGVEYGKKMGHQFITPSANDQKRWEKAMEPLFTEYVNAMKTKGLPGKEALDYRNQLIEKYGKANPSLKYQQ